MTRCPFCGEGMAAGATYCASCGYAPPAGGARPAARLDGHEGRRRAAAWAVAAVGAGLLLGFQLARALGMGGPPFAVQGGLAFLTAGLAFAVWRGPSSLRWLVTAIVGAWGAFMLFQVPSAVAMWREMGRIEAAMPGLNFGLTASQAVLSVVAVALLVRARR